MDQTYNVHMTDEAVADLKQAVDWIKEENVEAAQAFFVAIKLRINSDLTRTPHMGVGLQMVEGHNILTLTCGQYRIFYTVDDELNCVSIIRCLHTSRDIGSILKVAS